MIFLKTLSSCSLSGSSIAIPVGTIIRRRLTQTDGWPTDSAHDPKYAYFPFGAGLRHCIGKPIAEPEMKLVLSTIAQKYRLEHTENKPLEFDPAVTLQLADPIEMTVRER